MTTKAAPFSPDVLESTERTIRRFRVARGSERRYTA
jgi:hypothetical protein